MDTDKSHIRHCVLYEFHQGKNATKAAEAICSVYGLNAVNDHTCRRWFERFRNGNFDLEDEQRSGRPKEMVADDLQALLDQDPSQSTSELATQLNVDQSTISRRLNGMGKVHKAGKWVPYKFSENNKCQRLTTCVSLLARNKKKDYLWKIVTGDEKWIYYDNPVKKKQWLDPCQAAVASPKPNIQRKKVMLSVWWDMKGIIYFELLEPRQTINAERYTQQLKRLCEAIEERRPFNGHGKRKVILQHDNARPHVAKMTKQAIIDLGWEVLAHPAYSPDLAPSDYHLFRSMEHFLRGKEFENNEDLKKSPGSVFRFKTRVIL